MNNFILWAGALLLSYCGLPLLIETIHDGHADGVSLSFLLMWYIGEILMLIGTFKLKNKPLTFNYGLNTIMISIILWYKVF